MKQYSAMCYQVTFNFLRGLKCLLSARIRTRYLHMISPHPVKKKKKKDTLILQLAFLFSLWQFVELFFKLMPLLLCSLQWSNSFLSHEYAVDHYCLVDRRLTCFQDFAVVISIVIFSYLCISIVLQYVRFLKMDFLGQRVYTFKILINVTNSFSKKILFKNK